jgi:ADP-ribose pyrophosphatase YjhB (NUDIX family)
LIPVKHSIALAIFKNDQILAIRRPDNDNELPGIWGLPAGTRRDRETTADVIQRIGREKLGVKLTPVRLLSAGRQERRSYRLEMELWEVSLEGTPNYPEWRWASVDLLRKGAESGSLCCELALRESPQKDEGRIG